MIDAEELIRIQHESYERAGAALRSSWPLGSAMGAGQIADFLVENHYCVLATVSSQRRPQARPVAFTVVGSSFWFASGAGARLRNLERTPWVSFVVAAGDRGSHRVVTVDGPAAIVEAPDEEVLTAWEEKHGARAGWASAWFEVRPTRLFSYDGAS